MKLSVFSIHDRKAKAFLQPFYFDYKGQATRAFEDILKQKDNPVSKHPEDYSLHMLGTFDPLSGRLESLDVPEFIMNATDFEPNGVPTHV